ncbi:integral membrane sensor domain MASE1 [Rhizobium mongolense]|uniref:Integral membrane sensor domain MASE1 n=2 Tax=Rhizobium mongolense TaxID=57676 RepID=A0ABR6IFG9_9HYPH|nr:integral membrane sensor domain MASE1 [Rhizobium mongolense]TVZ73867.1 MASE1 protein [Rhizobium mongolense USDA 1844]
MMPVWPYRPHPRHLCLFIVAYVLGCGFAQALAIVPGTGISIWSPSGLFIATLVLVPRQSWPWWVLAGCFAELLSNLLWFHSPLPAAFLIYVGNALEAVVGALLVNWALKRSIRLETLQEVLAFVVLCAGVAPLVSATVGSATLAWFGIFSQGFAGAWPLVDRRRHRRLDRCTAGVDRDPELATRLSSRRPDGQKPASLG